MDINYDKEFEKIKRGTDKSRPPKLLLHVCCAPCATACLTRLIDAFDVTLYYANDNITDTEEWAKRLQEVKKLASLVNNGEFEIQPLVPLKTVVQPQRSERFFAAAKGLEREREGGARCTKCFELRLDDAKKYAEQNNFDYFATTLTVSPYKNSRLLNEIGLSLQTATLQWLPTDFKKQGGYNESIRLCKKYGIYRQHYCGCAYSFYERTELQSVPH